MGGVPPLGGSRPSQLLLLLLLLLLQVPDLGMCEQELPTIFLGSHTDFETAFHAAVAAGTGPIRLERPSTFDRPARDASCGSGKYYATYPSLPGAAFDVAACESSVSVTARAADIAGASVYESVRAGACARVHGRKCRLTASRMLAPWCSWRPQHWHSLLLLP